MGDPSKIRKKHSRPRHPWEGDRIEKERALIRKYGLKNKKEVWKMDSLLKSFKDQVKKLGSMEGEQAEREKKQLADRLASLGMIKKGDPLDSVLGLSVESIMDRRLQSMVDHLGLAKTARQARQFIVHEHVTVNGRKVTAPSYLVREGDEINFSDGSSLSDEMHPERVEKKPSKEKIEKKGETTKEKIEEAKKKSPSKKDQEEAAGKSGSEEKPEKTAKDEKEEAKGKEEETTAEGSDKEKSKEELPETESGIRSMTKDEMKKYAKEEYDIELDTNNLKDEMVENFIKGLKNE